MDQITSEVKMNDDIQQASNRLKQSLQLTFMSTSSQQIRKAQDQISVLAYERNFSDIVTRLFINLSVDRQAQSQNIQKSLLLLIQRTVREQFSTLHGDYINRQRLLSLLMGCISSRLLRVGIRLSLCEIVRTLIIAQSSSNWGCSQFQTSLIMSIDKCYRQIDILQQVSQSDRMSLIQMMILYGYIIVKNIGYLSVSFEFGRLALDRFTNVAYWMTNRVIGLVRGGLSIEVVDDDIVEILCTNIYILAQLLSDCPIMDQTLVYTYLSSNSSQPITLFQMLSQIFKQINCSQPYQFTTKQFIMLSRRILQLFNRVIQFLIRYNSKYQEKYDLKIVGWFHGEVLPNVMAAVMGILEIEINNTTGKQLIQAQSSSQIIKAPVFALLQLNLQLLKSSLNIHSFYPFFTRTLPTLIDKVIIIILKQPFYNTPNNQLSLEDYIYFYQCVIQGNQTINNDNKKKKRIIIDQQSIHNSIISHHPSILPLQLLRLQQQQQQQADTYEQQQQQSSTLSQSLLGCKQYSMGILRLCLAKIDGFKPYFFQSLILQMNNQLLGQQQRDTVYMMLIAAKQSIMSNKQMLVKVISFIERGYDTMISNLRSNKLDIIDKSHITITILCTFKCYTSVIYLHHKECNSLITFRGYIKELQHIIDQCLISSKIINNRSYYSQTTQLLCLLTLNILKTMACQEFGDQYVKIMFRIYLNVMQTIIGLVGEMGEMGLSLRFINNYFLELDEIIEYFSYELQGQTVLEDIVTLLVDGIVGVCKLNHHHHNHHNDNNHNQIQLLSQLLWRSLLTITSHQLLIVDIVDELIYLLEKILQQWKQQQITKQQYIINNSQCCQSTTTTTTTTTTAEYILIVATALMKYQRRLQSVSKDILLSVILTRKQQYISSPPFGYVFEFIQCLLLYSVDDSDEKSLIQIVNNKVITISQEHHNNKVCDLTQQLHNNLIIGEKELDLLQQMCMSALNICCSMISMMSSRQQLKFTQFVVIMHQIYLSKRYYHKCLTPQQRQSEFTIVLKLLNKLLSMDNNLHQSSNHNSKNYNQRRQRPKELVLIENCFTLLLLIINSIREQQHKQRGLLLGSVSEIYTKRMDMVNDGQVENFKYCTKINVVTLAQILCKSITGYLLQQLRTNVMQIQYRLSHQLSKVDQYQRQSHLLSPEEFLVYAKQTLFTSFIIVSPTSSHDSLYHQQPTTTFTTNIITTFTLLMQSLQQHFETIKQHRYQYHFTSQTTYSDSTRINFRNIQDQLINKYRHHDNDQMQLVKSCLNGECIQNNDVNSNNRMYLEQKILGIIQKRVEFQNNEEVDSTIRQLILIFKEQYSSIIGYCVAITNDCKYHQTMKAVIRMERVNQSHRQILKVK